MRIAVLLRDHCQPKKCNTECFNYCPKVRTGVEAVVIGEGGRPIISEELCAGCGICINKCPFEAIKIIGLPAEIKADLMHQYGMNGFRIYRLPVPKKGMVTGILGPNGIGKTTALRLLSGDEIPNLGAYEAPPSKEKVLEHLSGTELADYLEKVFDGKVRTALKPQYVDKLPLVAKGVVRDLLSKVSERLTVEEATDLLDLQEAVDRPMDKLSGGELQRVAIAASLMKDADVYFFDEPSSYLDIYQRIRVARFDRVPLRDKTGRRDRARPCDPGFPGRERVSCLWVGGCVWRFRSAKTGQDRDKHLSRWIYEGREHPIS